MPTPPELQVRAPWGASTERFLWYELRPLEDSPGGRLGRDPGLAALLAASASNSSGGSGERVMLAPAWVVAMENGLGHKG